MVGYGSVLGLHLVMATAKEAALGGCGRDVDGDALPGGEVGLAVVSVSESLLLDERRAVVKE